MGPEVEPAYRGPEDKQVHRVPTAGSFPASAVFRVFLFWEWPESLKPLASVQQDLCWAFLKFPALAVQEICPVFYPNLAVPGQLCAALQGLWVAWESQAPASVRSDQAKYPGALADLLVAQGALLSEAGPLAELLPVERRAGFEAAGQAADEIHPGMEVALLAAWSGSEPF